MNNRIVPKNKKNNKCINIPAPDIEKMTNEEKFVRILLREIYYSYFNDIKINIRKYKKAKNDRDRLFYKNKIKYIVSSFKKTNLYNENPSLYSEALAKLELEKIIGKY